jgi:hypothetical protein
VSFFEVIERERREAGELHSRREGLGRTLAREAMKKTGGVRVAKGMAE